ncbi:hypothetical protein diail_7952 [Diaporthe ilicicola]|nr:hypothetical protein diail_7952 [Diaporthe ilicicola]
MLAQSKSVLVALLLAYCAMGAPLPAAKHEHVRTVVEALKAKLEGADIAPEITEMFHDVEHAIGTEGTPNAELIDRLDQKIEAMTEEEGHSIDEIVNYAIQHVKNGGSIEDFDELQPGETLVLDEESIKEVLARGLEARRGGCNGPPGTSNSQFLCTCVIL